jgi:hypothetical protein
MEGDRAPRTVATLTSRDVGRGLTRLGHAQRRAWRRTRMKEAHHTGGDTYAQEKKGGFFRKLMKIAEIGAVVP